MEMFLKIPLNLKIVFWILKRRIENIEKKRGELCIATKNTKEIQIKGELQLVSMNETIKFISEKFDVFEKDRREKDKVIKNFS